MEHKQTSNLFGATRRLLFIIHCSFFIVFAAAQQEGTFRHTVEKGQTVVVLLLPFTTQQASAAQRFVEYYEGMLIAIDSMRNRGFSLELFVFDTGDSMQELERILQEESVLHADLIIGAVHSEQITRVARFAQLHNIKYVIPFTSQNNDVLSNRYIYQVNASQPFLYDKVAQAGCNLFADADANVILVQIEDEKSKPDFINAFKAEMNNRQMPFHELPYTPELFDVTLTAMLDPDRLNVILPTSASFEALDKIRTLLRILSTEGVDTQTYSIQLFGYPDWQTYLRDVLDDFHMLDTYIYSSFYANNLSPDVQDFIEKYKNWYSKDFINIYPKYGILGFDTGMFFFEAMRQYGVNFESHLDRMDYTGLQTNFRFERVNNWGGFINTNVFLVRYCRDYSLIRTPVR